MRRVLLPLAAMLLIVLGEPHASAELSWKDWKALAKRAEALMESDASLDEKREVAIEVATDGQPRAAKLLIGFVNEAVDRECAARERAAEIAADIPRGAKFWNEDVHAEIERLSETARDDRALSLALADAIAQGPADLRLAFLDAARKRKDKKLHRAAVRMAAHHPDDDPSRSFVLEALVGDGDPRIRLSALRALKVRAHDWGHWIADAVADPDWTVRIAAAHISAIRGIGESIGEMIKELSCSAPRVQHAYVASLHRLTSEEIGLDPSRWKHWWSENRSRFGANARPAAGPICVDAAYVPFYDLEIHSNRVLFLIDISESMLNQAVVRIGPNGRKVYANETRIDLVKRQLRRSIRSLEDGYRFNIVAFGDTVQPWEDELVASSEKTRRSAEAWVDKLKPDGSTTLNGALHWAFGRMGFGDGTVAPIDADTIVILSDGAPTDGWPDGRGTKGEEAVLAQIDHWNRHHSVVIHTVALRGARDSAVGFLKRLAEQNGGQTAVR